MAGCAVDCASHAQVSRLTVAAGMCQGLEGGDVLGTDERSAGAGGNDAGRAGRHGAPDDDPLLGAQRRRSRAEGYADGQAKERAELARALLAARGIEVSAGFPGVPGIAELPHQAIAEAAASCVSEADFQQRLRRR